MYVDVTTGVINNRSSSSFILRQLANHSRDLTRSLERLSSGLRINHASDDAAGLALSTDLDVKARLINQSRRNVDDTISLTTIAQASLEQLSIILTRQQELATQAANGTYTLNQRRLLQDEADQLTEEFNRIVATTTFNGVNIFADPESKISVQIGPSSSDSLQLSLGQSVGHLAGTGLYSSEITTLVTGQAYYLDATDINQDGKNDLITANFGGSTISIFYGNGNGTFAAPTTYTAATNALALEYEDVNRDSIADIVVVGLSGTLSVLFGNGNGTFRAPSNYAGGSNSRGIEIADTNNDGILDVITAEQVLHGVGVRLGNSDGSFNAIRTYSSDFDAFAVTTFDYDGDGNIDIVSGGTGASFVYLMRGNGNGTFKARTLISLANPALSLAHSDLDRDGIEDLIVGGFGSTQMAILLSNGNGTFKATKYFSTGDTTMIGTTITDINKDGLVDLVTVNNSGHSLSTLLGNGDGSFQAFTRVTTSASSIGGGSAADFNNDGVPDIVSANYTSNSLSLFLSRTEHVTTTPYLNLLNASDARATLDTLSQLQENLRLEIGNVGAYQSRLESISRQHSEQYALYRAAAARITDVDVASEVANLVRVQILQQASISLLVHSGLKGDWILDLLNQG